MTDGTSSSAASSHALHTAELKRGREFHAACSDLSRIAQVIDTDVLNTIAMHARGSMELAEGDAQARARRFAQCGSQQLPLARAHAARDAGAAAGKPPA